ncbi:MAG: sigma factor [Actinomycetota bacterium]
MSPEMKRDFEAEWGDLQERLRRFLFRKKVPASRHDDLVQETALRLLLMWDQVDRSRPPWPLTATIVTNLLKDQARVRPVREVAGEVPERAAQVDVERSGLARVELERVRVAMANLTPPQRAALLQEIGAVTGNGHSADAEKMLRHRARRKLSSIIRDVSAVAVLRYRRLVEMLQGFVPNYEGLLPTASCVICLLVGLTGGIVLETPAPAGAQGLRGHRQLVIAVASPVAMDAQAAPRGVDATTSARPTVPDSLERTPTNVRRAKAPTKGGRTTTSLVSADNDGAVPLPRTPPLPQPGDQPAEIDADAELPEEPQPPSQEDSPVQVPVPLPEAVTDPLGPVGDL